MADENSDRTQVRTKILHVLKVYPIISPAMLHIGIGTSVPTPLWRPVLDSLITEGLVVEQRVYVERELPNSKRKQHVQISLTKNARSYSDCTL